MGNTQKSSAKIQLLQVSIFILQHCYVDLYINPADHAPGVKNGPTPGSFAPTMGKHKNLLLRIHKAQSFHILCVAMYNTPLCITVPIGVHIVL